ncbi:MAG: hypothetical protein JEY96_19200 [Bacteroidales bacterium]|nr:hypothetical protein [Bacteroidales bacterium]
MSEEKISKHSAPGQMLGYLYQIDRALYWLSMCPPNSIVSIETDDDIVVDIKNGQELNKVFEQDKSSIGKRNPFSNKSKDLWKTLVIWLEIIKNNDLDIDNSRFLLVTNVKISKTCIAYQISNNNQNSGDDKGVFLIDKYKELKSIAEKPSKEVKSDAIKFLTYSQNDIISLLRRIELIDNDFPKYDRNDYVKRIAENLRLLNYPYNQIYDNLYGWIVSKITQFWLNSEVAYLNDKLLHSKKDEIVSLHIKKPFIEKTIDLLPIKDVEIEKEKNKIFVKQLQCIKLNEKEQLNAIQDFIRSKRERISHAENNRVLSRADFKNYEDDLKGNWEKVYNKHTRLSKDLDKLDCGYAIFQDTTDYRGNIKGEIPVQRYTSNGTYHKLSNNLDLGWHPDWEKIFNRDE